MAKQTFLAKMSIFAQSMFQFPESYCWKCLFKIFGDPLRASCDLSDLLKHPCSELAPSAETLSYAIVMNEKHEKELDQIVMDLVTSGWPAHPIKENADLDSRKS